jgi:NhaP-type Na+/H+ or K+/H+ antiporter
VTERPRTVAIVVIVIVATLVGSSARSYWHWNLIEGLLLGVSVAVTGAEGCNLFWSRKK